MLPSVIPVEKSHGHSPDEKDRGIQKDPVQVSFLCLELHREASRASGKVVGTRLATNRRETHSQWALGANFAKDLGHANVTDVLCAFERAMRTGTLGVNHTG